ncbi:PspA/IM30 family protein [Brooklawnia sp.]|uniref:PspA/IM30 family protein n=1 Tax=Brooklawnia sp. TaxID=2699740 RepID=UPI00311F34E9
MAGIIDRIARAFGSQNGDPKPANDTRGELEDAYTQQIELLQQVRRGASSVASSRRRLAAQLVDLAAEIDSLTGTAHRLIDQGQDRLAQEALVRKQTLLQQLAGAEAQHRLLQREEENLILTATRLQAKVDSIRAKQHTVWAQDSAAEASAKVTAALGGIDLGQAGAVVQRADALLQAPVEPESPAADELNAAAADELTAIRAELVGRAPAAPGQGSYVQPGGYPTAGVTDSTGETG